MATSPSVVSNFLQQFKAVEEKSDSEFIQTDSDIERNRVGRIIVTIISPPLFLFLGYVIGTSFGALFSLPYILGKSVGLGLGASAAAWAWNRSFIENNVTQAFVTINPIASLFNQNPHVPYGPGKHWCYWFEYRFNSNTVSLVEVAEPFKVVIQVQKGTLTGKGSTRFRPDIQRLPQFLNGAAAVAVDIVGLIKSKVVQFIPKDLKKALSPAGIKALNDKLAEVFKQGKNPVPENKEDDIITSYEDRFGIKVGDTTLEELLPSEEIMETLSGVTEMEVVNEMVAKSFACRTLKEVEAGIAAKQFSREDVNRVRTQIMAATGNLQGMDLKDHNINVNLTGLDKLDPRVVEGLASVGAGMASAMGSGQKAKSSNRAKNQERRTKND